MSDCVPSADKEINSALSSTSKPNASKPGPKASPVWTDCFNKRGAAKSGRTPYGCKFCTFTCDGRVADAEKHIANVCTKVPQELQVAAQARVASKADSLPVEPLINRSEKRQRTLTGSVKKQQSLTVSGQVDSFKVSTAQKQTWDMGLLRWIVMSGIPFNAVNSPFFVTWVNSLRPNYRVVGVPCVP